MSKGKMHELLAVEKTIAANYQRDLTETKSVLAKPEMFTKIVKTLTHFDDASRHLDATDVQDMTTTVRERLGWFGDIAAKFYDVQLQKDKTNQSAVADLVVDGKVLTPAVPATTLLMLETKLQDLRAVIAAAPTLTAGTEWLADPTEGDAKYVTVHDLVSFKNKKSTIPVVLYPATDKHPAQVEKVVEETPVGRYVTKKWSGALSSADKADVLGRLDELLQATKVARQKANQADADSSKFGAQIIGFILG